MEGSIIEPRAALRTSGRWRVQFGQLRRNKTVRKYVRCCLLGLVSFGPIG